MARWKTDPWWPQPTWGVRKPVQSWSLEGGITGQLGDWASLRTFATPIRHEVFVLEQGVPADEEWDLADRFCRHVVVHDTGQTSPGQAALATGRLLPDGRIGRMAVRLTHRKTGLGGWVLQRLMHEAQQLGMSEVLLHAQVHALGFYERHGFISEGPEFLECEMPHRLMRRALGDL
jgi:predicted GNAT family N-acyltransferase